MIHCRAMMTGFQFRRFTHGWWIVYIEYKLHVHLYIRKPIHWISFARILCAPNINGLDLLVSVSYYIAAFITFQLVFFLFFLLFFLHSSFQCVLFRSFCLYRFALFFHYVNWGFVETSINFLLYLVTFFLISMEDGVMKYNKTHIMTKNHGRGTALSMKHRYGIFLS